MGRILGLGVLICFAAVATAQPYQPRYLLDVTGDVNYGIGLNILAPLGDIDGDGRADVLSNASWGVRIYFGTISVISNP